MAISPLAGKPAPPEILIDVDKLEKDYFEKKLAFTIGPMEVKNELDRR